MFVSCNRLLLLYQTFAWAILGALQVYSMIVQSLIPLFLFYLSLCLCFSFFFFLGVVTEMMKTEKNMVIDSPKYLQEKQYVFPAWGKEVIPPVSSTHLVFSLVKSF